MLGFRIGVGVALALYVAAGATACLGSANARTPSSPNGPQELDRDTYLRRIAPDLAIRQVAAPTVAPNGSRVAFTLTVTNKRPQAAPTVVVTDVLPRSMTFVSCRSTADGVCAGDGNNRTVTFESLPGGVSATIELVATVNADVPPGTVMTNTATVSFDGIDPDTSDNAASATVTATRP